MKLLVNQPFGLGDVIFCMTIIRRWIKDGWIVTWPVFPQFVEQLNRAYPDVTFVDWQSVKVDYDRRDEHDWNGYRVVPLRWNVQLMNVPYTECMSSKYSLFGWDWREWKEGAMWNRSKAKEEELHSYQYIDFKMRTTGQDGYAVVNTTYGSDAKLSVVLPSNYNGLPTIELKPIERFSLFDWAGILEGATVIHTVSTSIIYILEMLDIKCPIHIYKREPIEKNHDNYSYILQSHNYILH